jgi:hypothetical protein
MPTTKQRTDFTGTIIEESLADRSVLDGLKIVSTEIEPVTKEHKTPWIKQWTMHKVEVPAEIASETADKMSKALDGEHEWYADYNTDAEHYIIYRDKVFHITDRSDKEQYDKAAEYGISIGIPAYQVDFSPHVKQWERKNT